jgi:Flp pilus assembly pilin Flp
MKKYINIFFKDENGQAMVEYVLLLFILTVVSFAGFKLLIEAWKMKFNNIKNLRAGPAGIFP